ncbi:restriction endonuclease subunit S [Enterococcus faecium]|uniref:restriction endonuclease subunit S n=1 Tax=Enterococcus faecium TaxID=1352 RepID=UPI000CF220CA|nr:restriction endonuclease subunit S [Enterococcus faecium]EME8091819.1 restriction endonuclease subunit S [Enterococcus faecium]EME8243737.1 restriction endonuclease subunit S [Enterococcus faecium]PQF94320.1 restriction endonuclease subunit S [Enterococcus faecium]PQG43842.1 restriction endonuclease subunit S [Enterococcus faecium]
MSNDTQPEIRFPGFTDDWEQRKLGEVVQIVMGQSPNSENYTDNPNDYILVQGNADMKNNRVVPRVWTTQVTKQAEKGDLILSVRAPVGDIGKTDYDVVLGRGVAAIKGNDFIFQQLGKMKENGYWNRYSTGSTFESINSNDIREALITIPDVKEQQKIGAFFKQLDDTIALHQRKLDLLKETKKGFLQKMFPKNGAKVPEIRFPGFTEDWEQRKLGELATIVRGASPRPIQDPKWFDTESDVGWLRIADVTEQDGRIYYLEQHISKLGQEKTRVLVEPHLLLSIAATVGKPVVNYVKTGVHDGFLIFLNAIFDREFMFQWLEMFRPKWQKYGQPGSQVNLNSELVRNQEILIPNNEEQQKIGSFFKQLDDTIALHQRELDVLKETKKGFLQKMFV